MTDGTEEVRSVLARYSHLVDDGRRSELDRVFAAEATLDLFGTSHSGLPAVIAALGGDRPPTGNRHLTTNVAVEVAGEEARAVSDWFLMAPAAEGGWRCLRAGRYEDRLRREDDGWRITVRRITAAEPGA